MFFQHWCVYFGIDAHTQEHIVYHFGQRDNPSASPSNISAEICMAPLKEVAKNCQCRKNNEKDSVRPAFSENDIRQRCLARAVSLLFLFDVVSGKYHNRHDSKLQPHLINLYHFIFSIF